MHVWGQRVCGKSLYLPLNYSVKLKLFYEVNKLFLKSSGNSDDGYRIL